MAVQSQSVKTHDSGHQEQVYNEAAKLLVERKRCVVLTGAGISAESGIPTFRSKGGMWEKYDPAVYASIDVFRRDPSKYWTIRGDFIRNYDNYQPNPGHVHERLVVVDYHYGLSLVHFSMLQIF